MKGLLPPIALLLVLAAAIGVGIWEPWTSHERDAEVEWLETYAAWSDRVEAALVAGGDPLVAGCDRIYPEQLRDPPKRLAEAGKVVVAGCRRTLRVGRTETPAAAADEWRQVRQAVLADLIDRRSRDAEPAPSEELARAAAPLAGVDPEAFCWSGKHWNMLSEDWRLVRRDEFWLAGFADATRGRIDLAPEICEPLGRFFGGNYTPGLNAQSLELSVALLVLAHEAEHLRSPAATEAEVECVSIQRVRDLVEDAGRAPSYAELMAGLAWEVGYPNLPAEYRTADCRDGGSLDVRPDTAVWP